MPDRYRVQAVEKAIRILLAFKDKPELSTTELSKILGVQKSSTFHLCSTLVEFGFLEQNERKKYRLGLALFELGALLVQRMDLRVEALPVLRRLRNEMDETVQLAVRHDSEVVFIEKLEPDRSGLHLHSQVGRRLPLIRGAIGKTLLAYLDPVEQQQILATVDFTPLTQNSPKDSQQLLAELAEIFRQGYALDREEVEPGVFCVGAPIRDHDGGVVGAISVSGPAFRLVTALPSTIQRVLQAAADISRALGWLGNEPPERVAVQ